MMPTSGTPIAKGRDAERSPANGASASAAARAYRPTAIRCEMMTTERTRPAPPNGAADRRSGRHLPDEPHGHARNEVRMTDIHDQPGGRVGTRVDDLQDHLGLLRRGPRHPRRRPVDLEHVAGRHPFGAAPIHEHDLLRADEHVEIALGDDHTLEPARHWRRAHGAGVLERLEW